MSRQASFGVLALTILFTLFVPPASAQQLEPQQGPRLHDPLGDTGFLLSDGMVKALVKRSAYELARTLKMDDEQTQRLAQKADELWMPFIHQHRGEAGPLIERMIEAQWDPDLPSAEEAKSWARRALKLQQLFAEQAKKSNLELAKLLTPQQAGEFKKLTERFDAGLKMFKGELEKIEKGELHETTWAKRRLAQQERRRRYAREEQRQTFEGLLSSPELAALTVDAWDAYVARFAEQFNLDDAQKLAATSVLDDVKQRAQRYAKSRADDLEAVARDVRAAPADQRQKIVAQRAELVKPLNDLFAELQARLQQIPTEAQRSQDKPVAQPTPTGEG